MQGDASQRRRAAHWQRQTIMVPHTFSTSPHDGRQRGRRLAQPGQASVPGNQDELTVAGTATLPPASVREPGTGWLPAP